MYSIVNSNFPYFVRYNPTLGLSKVYCNCKRFRIKKLKWKKKRFTATVRSKVGPTGKREQETLSMSLPSFCWTFIAFSVPQSIHNRYGLLWRGISPSQGRYLHTEQHKHIINTDIHALSGIRTHNRSVRAREHSSWLRTRGHCDRRETVQLVRISPFASTSNIDFALSTPNTIQLVRGFFYWTRSKLNELTDPESYYFHGNVN
jgi:hypothetical protein